MMQQGVNQCAGPVARRRVNHKPGGFVDNDQRVIFKHNRKLYGLGFWNGGFGFGNFEAVELPGFDPGVGFNYYGVIAHGAALLDEGFNARAA